MTIYGPPETQPIREDQSTMPISYYGISKYASERYVLATSARQDLGGRFSGTAMRMFNVYGPRQSLDNPYQGVTAIFLSNLLRETEVKIFGDGEQSRDFVFVEDVVRAWLLALDAPIARGRAYNVGSGEAVSINRFVNQLQSLTGAFDVPINHYPERPGEQRHTTADVSRAEEELGWRRTVSFEEGLARTLEWSQEILGG
jgi:UDP-glucose 4-epimerase